MYPWTVMETIVCPMGGGATRLYSALTQTRGSSPLPLPLSQQPDNTNLDPAFCQEQKGSPACPPDPAELLRQCEEALGDRPHRLHRKFTHLNDGDSAPSSPIRVMQWNILAQGMLCGLARPSSSALWSKVWQCETNSMLKSDLPFFCPSALGEGLDSFVQCPPEALSWSRRKYLILEEILTYRPHILCLQEVDHYYDTLQPVLAGLGYSSNFCPKPWSPCLDVEGNNGPDGCALFFDQSRYEFLDSVSIRLTAIRIPTNQVAVVTMLRCRSTGRCVCVAVTHLKARSGWEWLRSAQGSDLLRQLQTLVQKHVGAPSSDIPLLICGDFNAIPTEEVYRRFAASPLGLDSAYKKLSQDGLTEPEYTTWKIRPTGECCSTLDYIWYSQHTLRVDAVLDMPTEEQIGPNRLPSFSYPSDHLSLVCDFSFKEEE